MPSLSSTCSKTVSILALVALPGDRVCLDSPITHSDFSSSTGYIRRIIHGAVCHAVDWDGAEGIDTIFRENGKRSGPLWREFREWRKTSESPTLTENGNKACELLLKYFGPYHEATSQTLTLQRNLENEKTAIAKLLDKECPPAIRMAAQEYATPHLAHTLKIPSPLPFLTTPLLSATGVFHTNNNVSRSNELVVAPTVYSRSEQVLRDYIETNSTLQNMNSLGDAVKAILEKTKPLEDKLDTLDIQLALATLPSIPGETHPADMDLLEYGSLICRHRAVIVALLLADAGFDVEVVEGTITRAGNSGRHLFVYADGRGILEPSATGPAFWQRTVSVDTREGVTFVAVEGGAVYHFHHRIPLSPCTERGAQY